MNPNTRAEVMMRLHSVLGIRQIDGRDIGQWGGGVILFAEKDKQNMFIMTVLAYDKMSVGFG
jgi:hypothetical protein